MLQIMAFPDLHFLGDSYSLPCAAVWMAVPLTENTGGRPDLRGESTVPMLRFEMFECGF